MVKLLDWINPDKLTLDICKNPHPKISTFLKTFQIKLGVYFNKIQNPSISYDIEKIKCYKEIECYKENEKYKKLKPNMRVTVNYKNKGKYYLGHIRHVRDNGTYDIFYCDGDGENEVPPDRICIIDEYEEYNTNSVFENIPEDFNSQPKQIPYKINSNDNSMSLDGGKTYFKTGITVFEMNEQHIWNDLAVNPSAIDIIEENIKKMNWLLLSKNPAAIKLLKENPSKIDYYNLGYNTSPEAFSLLPFDNPSFINWHAFNENTLPEAIDFLKKHPYKIIWSILSKNPAAIEILESNLDKVDWDILSLNPAAIHLLEANQNKIFWTNLSANPAAIHLLEANPDKINWKYLSANPKAIHLLKENQDKIDWNYFSENPAIFEDEDEL